MDLDAEDPDAFDLGAKGKHRKRLNSVLKFFTMFQKKEFQDEEGELGRLADLPVGSPSLVRVNTRKQAIENMQSKTNNCDEQPQQALTPFQGAEWTTSADARSISRHDD